MQPTSSSHPAPYFAEDATSFYTMLHNYVLSAVQSEQALDFIGTIHLLGKPKKPRAHEFTPTFLLYTFFSVLEDFWEKPEWREDISALAREHGLNLALSWYSVPAEELITYYGLPGSMVDETTRLVHPSPTFTRA